MNLMSSSHLSSIKNRLMVMAIVMGSLFNSCKKDTLTIPVNVGTIRFAANSYTIENNTVDPLTVVLPLSLPLEEDATAVISVDNASTILSSEYTTTPNIPPTGLTLNLPKGATEISFKVSSLNNFEGEKNLVFKLSSATGGLTVANTNATTTINIKGNPIVYPEIKLSETGLAFGNIISGMLSAAQSYTVSGVKLTADIAINAPANFQVSLNNVAFSNTLSIPFATANAGPVTIYARFNANTGINQSLTGSITHSSGVVPDAALSVSGVEYGVAAPGILIQKEDLDYGTTAGALTARSGGNWVAFSAAGSSAVQYVNPGLTYTGYVGSGIGGALISENGSGSREDLSNAFTSQNTGVIYAAQLMNFASAPSSADFFFSFGDGIPSATPLYFNRIYVKASGSQFSIGISRNASTTAVYGATNLEYGTTYLVVSKYEFATGKSTLYIVDGAIPSIEPPTPTAISSGGAADPSAITRVVIRQNTTSPLKVTVDGIRIATSWKEAVGQ